MSWWKHLELEIPKLAEKGFTQIWTPPPNKAATANSRGYDAYDLWDLGEFAQPKQRQGTRWGNKTELLDACRAAREAKVDLLIDAVLNHKFGGEQRETFQAVPVQPTDRLKEIGPVQDVEGWSIFEFPGRAGKYSDMTWNSQHFSGLDWDQRTKASGVFRISGDTHQGWSPHVDSELGNYDYLMGMDINHRHPDVETDLLNWGDWVLTTTSASGFRLDAVKHIDYTFLLKFIRRTRKNAEQPGMFAVSEYWSGDLRKVMEYIKIFQHETAFFDVPLHMNFHRASIDGSRYDLRKILGHSLVKKSPSDAVTFVDNHDTVVGQSLASWVGSNFKIQAYAIILLRAEGHPCVFYGDLYPNQEYYDANTGRELERLISIRQKFAYGHTRDYTNGRNCIGWVRMGDETHPGCAVVLSNSGETNTSLVHTIWMRIGRKHAGHTFKPSMSEDSKEEGRVVVGNFGWGVFTCRPNRVQVWVPAD